MDGLTAKDVMNGKVWTVQADWPIDYLAEFLVEHTISGAPVVLEDGTLVGVVSETDIVRHDSLAHREPQTHKPHEYYLHTLDHQYTNEDMLSFRIGEASQATVRDIMTPAIFSVSEETSVEEVADTMITGRIHRVLVTRQNKMVGIITTLDLLKVIRSRRMERTRPNPKGPSPKGTHHA